MELDAIIPPIALVPKGLTVPGAGLPGATPPPIPGIVPPIAPGPKGLTVPGATPGTVPIGLVVLVGVGVAGLGVDGVLAVGVNGLGTDGVGVKGLLAALELLTAALLACKLFNKD